MQLTRIFILKIIPLLLIVFTVHQARRMVGKKRRESGLSCTKLRLNCTWQIDKVYWYCNCLFELCLATFHGIMWNVQRLLVIYTNTHGSFPEVGEK